MKPFGNRCKTASKWKRRRVTVNILAEEPNATPPPEPLSPRDNSVLFGHELAVNTLFEGWHSGKLHHAWLLSGPRGIGKAMPGLSVAALPADELMAGRGN